MFSSSLLLLSIGKLDLPPPNSPPPPPPPPEFIGAAASRIYHGAPSRQPDLIAASRESDGGAAQESNASAYNEISPVPPCRHLAKTDKLLLFH